MKRFKAIVLCLTVVFALSAIVVSAASASSRAYGTCTSESGHAAEGPCAVNEKFNPFSESGEMVVSHSATSFLLLSETLPVKGIECKTLSDMGIYKNVTSGTEEVAESEDTLVFQTCTPVNLSGCTEVNPKMSHEISGSVTDEVSANGKKVEIKIPTGQFNIKCIIGGEEVELGNVTGSATGTVNGNKLEFSKAKGLTFFGTSSTITGTNLTETLGKEPVLVCVG